MIKVEFYNHNYKKYMGNIVICVLVNVIINVILYDRDADNIRHISK